jgi:hypothetical protein
MKLKLETFANDILLFLQMIELVEIELTFQLISDIKIFVEANHSTHRDKCAIVSGV